MAQVLYAVPTSTGFSHLQQNFSKDFTSRKTQKRFFKTPLTQCRMQSLNDFKYTDEASPYNSEKLCVVTVEVNKMRSHTNTFQGKAKLPPGRVSMTTCDRQLCCHVCIDSRWALVQRFIHGAAAARDFPLTVPAVLCASAKSVIPMMLGL